MIKPKPHRWQRDDRCLVCSMHRSWEGARHSCPGIANLAVDEKRARENRRKATRRAERRFAQ